MPIVTIKSAQAVDKDTADRLISDIKGSGAFALGCTENNIWVLLQRYEEDHQTQDLPIIANIEANEGRNVNQRTSFIKVATTRISENLNVKPGNVWVHYQELKPLNISFGAY